MKEYRFGEAEKAPSMVKLADETLGNILNPGPAVLLSSYKNDTDYAPNLGRMLKISGRETHLEMIKQPKGSPDIVFVGTEFDLNAMRASITDRGEGAGWDLLIKSHEGERIVVILKNKVFMDQNTDPKKHMTHPVVDTRKLSTGEQIPAVDNPADLIIVFVGARLQESGTSYGSVNAHI